MNLLRDLASATQWASLRGRKLAFKVVASLTDRSNLARWAGNKNSLMLLVFSSLIFSFHAGTAQWNTNGTSVYYNGGNVGIGTNSPDYLLNIHSSNVPTLAIGKLNQNTNGKAKLYFFAGDANARNGFSIDYNKTTSTDRLAFTDGGGVEVLTIKNGGKVGIGTISPASNLHIANSNGGGIRLGGIGEVGVTNIAIGSQAASFNIDFSGYRDIVPDQIGARIAALRFNNYIAGQAYVQNTALAFYTNPSGYTSGTTDLYERMRISPAGDVGIGTTTPQNKLDVNGTVHAKEVKVDLTGWPDYVFAKDYALTSLEDLKSYIEANQHLPEVPSSKQVEAEGVKLGEMNKVLLKKIEELTLYVIDLKEQVQKQQTEIENLKK